MLKDFNRNVYLQGEADDSILRLAKTDGVVSK